MPELKQHDGFAAVEVDRPPTSRWWRGWWARDRSKSLSRLRREPASVTRRRRRRSRSSTGGEDFGQKRQVAWWERWAIREACRRRAPRGGVAR